MSKRLNNAIDPFETLDKFGPDATRWYMISNANPWDNLKFDIEGIAEVQRKFFGTLYNTYSFFSLYANIDQFGFKNENFIPNTERSELDQWILSELNSLIKVVGDAYQDYEATIACRAISDFVQEKLSNWYVRLSRRRFWKDNYGPDKIAAYQTLYECLLIVSQLGAPVAPFFMHRLYQDLTRNKKNSIHLSEFPNPNQDLINSELESQINIAREITSLALSLRKKQQIKVRQPLEKMIIPVKNELQKKRIKNTIEQLKSEINIKKVELLDDANDLLVKEVRPNFKIIGPKYGKEMKSIVDVVKNLNSEQVNLLEEKKELNILVNKKNIILDINDVDVIYKDIEGWEVAKNSDTTIALDVTITQKLKNEGVARELVNRIQNYRKDSGLEVTDRIDIILKSEFELEKAIRENKNYILNETLANTLKFESTILKGTPIEFENFKTEILIKKVLP